MSGRSPPGLLRTTKSVDTFQKPAALLLGTDARPNSSDKNFQNDNARPSGHISVSRMLQRPTDRLSPGTMREGSNPHNRASTGKQNKGARGRASTRDDIRLLQGPKTPDEQIVREGGSKNHAHIRIKADNDTRRLDADERVGFLTEGFLSSTGSTQVDDSIENRATAVVRLLDAFRPRSPASAGNFRSLSDGEEPSEARNPRLNSGRRPGGPMTALSPLRGALPAWFAVSQESQLPLSTGAHEPPATGDTNQKKEVSKHEDKLEGGVGERDYGAEKRQGEDFAEDEVSKDTSDKVFAESDLPPIPTQKTRDLQPNEAQEEQHPRDAEEENRPTPALGANSDRGSEVLQAEAEYGGVVGRRDLEKPEDRTGTLPSADTDSNEGQNGIEGEDLKVEKENPRDAAGGAGGQTESLRERDTLIAGGILGGTEQYLLDFLAGRETHLKARAEELERQQHISPPAALLAQVALVHDLREMLEKRFSESASLLIADGWDFPLMAAGAADSTKRGEVERLADQKQQQEAHTPVSEGAPDNNFPVGDEARQNDLRGEEGKEAPPTSPGSTDHTEGEDAGEKRQRGPPSPQEDEEEEERLRGQLKTVNARRRRYEAAAVLWTARKCAGLTPILQGDMGDQEVTIAQLSGDERATFTELLSSSGFPTGDEVGRGEEDLRLCPADDEAFAFLREASKETTTSGKPSETSASQLSNGHTSAKNLTCALWRQGCLVCGCFSGHVVCSRYCVAAGARSDAQEGTKRLALACCLVEPKETGQFGDLFDTLPQTLLAVPYGHWDDGVISRRRRPKTSREEEENLAVEQNSAGSATPDDSSNAEEFATSGTSRPSSGQDAAFPMPPTTARQDGQSSPSGESTRSNETQSMPPEGAAEGTAVNSAGETNVPVLLEYSNDSSSAGITNVPPLRENNNADDIFTNESVRLNTQVEATKEEEQNLVEEKGKTMQGLTGESDPAVNSLTALLLEFNPTTRAAVEAAVEAASRAVKLASGAQRNTGVFPPLTQEMAQQQAGANLLPQADSVDQSQPSLQGRQAEEEAHSESPALGPDVPGSILNSMEATVSSFTPPEALTAPAYQEMLTAASGSPGAQTALAAALMQLLQPSPPSALNGSRPTENASDSRRGNTVRPGEEQSDESVPREVAAADELPGTHSPLDNLLQLLRQQAQQQQLQLSPQQVLQSQQQQQGEPQEQVLPSGSSQPGSANVRNRSEDRGPAPMADVPPDFTGRDVGPYTGPPVRCPVDCEVFFDGCTTCQCFNGNAAPTCRPRWCRRMATAPTCLQVRPAPGPLDCPLKCFQTFDGCSLCACDGRGHRLSCRDLCALQNPLQRRGYAGEKRCVRQM